MLAPSAAVKCYLVAYNVFSCLGWSYIFFVTTFHLLGFTSTSKYYSYTVSTLLTRVISSIPFATGLASALPTKNYIATRLPDFLIPLYERMQTTYAVCGPATTVVQSFAVFEILHSLAGLVKSPIGTTSAQVFSRLFLVWGITERFGSTRTNPLYASMVFAWSLAEVVRYSFYAASLMDSTPFFLLYLRYTLFYVLYPVGASSEAFLIYASLPASGLWKFTPENLMHGNWKWPDYLKALMFVIWWPGLYILVTYMIKQRAKMLGGRRTKYRTE